MSRGRFKAAFFRTLGYTSADWLHLQQSLVAHALTVRSRSQRYADV